MKIILRLPTSPLSLLHCEAKGHFSLRILPIWTAIEPYAGPEYSKVIGILVNQFSQAGSIGEPK